MKTNNNTPKVTLVGAGPGDIELITVKGLKAIQQADVILYDALVNEELLNDAPHARHIFVGKRKGFKAYSQDEINRLIVDNALLYGNVVRLKGGDSFVFGRGYEEIQYAEIFDIQCEVIPGISSSISVPALAGIPVTHRGVSNSFYVLTGTLSDGSLNPEINNAVLSSGTVVILMGLSKLPEIIETYTRRGKSEQSVAIISNGSLPNEKTVVGKINNIEKTVREEGIVAPAIILIGDVVDLQQKYDSILKEVLQY
jgi:uroporphyrin-III C-methyltransferase